MKCITSFLNIRQAVYLLLLSLGCCTRSPIIDDLRLKLDTCSTIPCYVDLRNIAGIDWVDWYCFEEYTTASTISSVIDLKYSGSIVPDSYYRIVLVTSDNDVFDEDVSHRMKDGFQFLRKDWKNDPLVHYSARDSVWIVKKTASNHTGRVFYNVLPKGYRE